MTNSSNYRIDANDVLKQTNDGLTVILNYYPDAIDCVDGKKTHFRARNEKTPSARLTRAPESNIWVVTDFGGDQVSRNAIEIVRMEEGLSFYEALKFIVEKFNLEIEGATKSDLLRAKFTKRPASKDEREGEVTFKIRLDGMYEDGAKPKFFDYELKEVLGPHVTPEVCQELNLYPLESYTRIKDRQAMTFESTEKYPIFMIDEGDFQKIYQPLSIDKKFRFQYAGNRPKTYVFGLDFVRNCYEAGKAAAQNDDEEFKLPRIIICMGDRDAINVRSLSRDNYVIWLNSESQSINGPLYKELMTMTDNLYQVPDLDVTGRKHGIHQALKFLDLKTVWLPQELTKIRDWRGNFCKDVTDYIKRENGRAKKDFEQLISVAPTARFWDEIPVYVKDSFSHMKYEFNNVHAYYFLNMLGVYRFRNKNEKTGYIYIKIDDHIVREVEPVDIKNLVNDFLENRRKQARLRNMVYKTPQLSEGSLCNIGMTEIDFTDFEKEYQYLFFSNKTWKVTSKEIIEMKANEGDRYVWEDEVIDKKAKLLNDFFTITKIEAEDGLEELDIKIHNKECLFFRYLIQTSRIHWQKELEDSFASNPDGKEAQSYAQEHRFSIDGPNLSEEERYEQKMHLINKIYALGYLLHRYKDPSKPWAVFAMDNKISEEDESHGGAGKSICFKAPKFFMKTVEFNGRNKKLTDNPHIYENVTVHTDYILIDDADRYLNFEFFFKPLTGDLDVNPKGTRQYSIPFAEAPKFCITSNYTMRKIDPSTERRLLYTVFSDYYHYNSNNEYRQHRNPYDDFGKNLFDDFTEDEWNLFFNFMAQCIKFYLSHPSKIDPPMKNVQMRNLKSVFGDAFGNWAEIYFTQDRLNTEIGKAAAFKDYQDVTNMHKATINNFTKRLKAWCKYHGHTYNPESKTNNGNRIIKTIDSQSVEMIYIQTADRQDEFQSQINQMEF